MVKRFKIGNHVSWNSEAGRVSGTIIAIHTRDFGYKGHVHHASEDDPQYEIKSDKTNPMSRANPQFNMDTFPDALAAFQISYKHIAALGGLRGKARSLTPDVNGFWTNESFHNYADYALSEHFHAGLEHLLDEGRKRRCAIMCSEAVWWRCHRRIVADYLIAYGETVFHIIGRGRLEPARLTPGAVIQPGGTVVYPAAHRSDP